MRIHDPIYGTNEITEPLLLELIQSSPVQRLKGVKQHGAQCYIRPEFNETRYEHSIGVMLLLRKFNASLEEQAAGLLHDTGHTAFSHVIDVVFKEYDHNYDDAHVEEIIGQSNIPKILENHDIDWKKIAKKENYSLLEQSIPALCADRIDYALHDALLHPQSKHIPEILSDLTTHDGQFVFQTVAGANAFARLYIQMDRDLWNEPRGKASYGILAEAIRIALNQNIISEKDLYLTDAEVLQKMRAGHHKEIDALLDLLTPELKVLEDNDAGDYAVIQKGRWVDPPVLTNGQTTPLSQLDHEILPLIEERKKLNGQKVGFIIQARLKAY